MQPLIEKPKANGIDDAVEPETKTKCLGSMFARAMTFVGHGLSETRGGFARSMTLIGDGSCVPGGRPKVATFVVYLPTGRGGSVFCGLQAGSCGVASLAVPVQPWNLVEIETATRFTPGLKWAVGLQSTRARIGS